MSFSASVVYLNAGSEEDAGIGKAPPDKYQSTPSNDFVLCRDGDLKPTAVYGSDSWDFNPYRLSARALTVINFKNMVECPNKQFEDQLIGQVKHLLYNFMFFSTGGRMGKTSAATLIQYYYTLKSLAAYCVDMLSSDLARGITPKDILSNPAYLNSYLRNDKSSGNQHKNIKAFLGVLGAIDKKVVGFTPCSPRDFQFELGEDQQHPVIPSRIYLTLMSHFDSLLEAVHEHRDNLEAFILLFEDRDYGLAVSTQEGRSVEPLRPTADEAIRDAGLDSLLKSGPFSTSTRHGVVKALGIIQYVAKMVIHLYTGMRDQETLRLKYNCLGEKEISPAIVDGEGVVKDSARMLSLISTTTKFTGHKKSAAWIAPEQVLKAVQVAQSICKAVCALRGVNYETAPLFLNTNIIRSTKSKVRTTSFTNLGVDGMFTALAIPELHIKEGDLAELELTDPERDFSSDERFSVGALWPLSSHQFRRSLAVYACNSGFVSMPTITAQFHHLSRLMAQYYAKGHGNMMNIFGTANSPSHIAFEFQLAAPIEAVQQLYLDVFESDSTLLGGTGSYLEKQKAKVYSGEISLSDSKRHSEQKALKGEMNYQKTLLGGCTKNGICDDFLKGDYIACLSCADAVINDGQLDDEIKHTKSEIPLYEIGSGEREWAENELKELEKFKRKNDKKKVAEDA